MKLYISDATLRTVQQFGNASLTHIASSPTDHMCVELDVANPTIASTAASSAATDVGHALIERLRKTMTRLGVFPGEGLEWFAANLENNLYSLDRAVNKLLNSVAASSVATVKVYETYTGQNGWIEVTQEEYDRTKDKYEHRIRRVPAPLAATVSDEASVALTDERIIDIWCNTPTTRFGGEVEDQEIIDFARALLATSQAATGREG
jgi:hypothetical protein